jgi:hypothetical protein
MSEDIKVNGGINLSLYEMNKQVISQLPEIEDIAVLTPIRKYKNKDGKYFMLLCRDLNYYTLFVIDLESDVRIEQEVLECLKELGTIKSVEEFEDKNLVEIWVQPEDSDPVVMYFFNYDRGVIPCH